LERALLQLSPGTGEADGQGVQQRILDAWKRRHTGGDPNKPTLLMVGGYAGSGKSEFARFISQLTGWPVLDKDPITRPLVERLLIEMGSDPNDRHTDSTGRRFARWSISACWRPRTRTSTAQSARS